MNEIPTSLFIALGVLLSILILYTLIKGALLTSLLSTIISAVMAQSIINGNVNQYYFDNTAQTVVLEPVQSLPIHYLLLGISSIMTIFTFYIIVKLLLARTEDIGNEGERGSEV